MEDKDFELLQDEHLDCLITLAFKKMAIEEAQRIIEEFDRQETEEEKKACDRAYAQFLDKLGRREKEEKRRISIACMKKTATRVLQVAACMLLIVALIAPVAIAKVEPLRSSVLRFLISLDEEQGAVNFDMVIEEELALNVPEGWQGEYYMTYIPEGFDICSMSAFRATVEYRDSNDRKLSFAELMSSTSSSVDNEDAETWYTMVQGRRAYVISKNDWHAIIWSIDDRYFEVIYDGSYEETLVIANGVRKVIYGEN